MKKIIQRVLVVFLVAAVAVALVVCIRGVQKQIKTEEIIVEDGFVWVTKYVYPEITKKQLDIVRTRDNYLYYVDEQYNVEDGQSSTSIPSISLLDGSKGPTIPIEMERPETPDGEQMYVSRKLSRFTFDSEGKVLTVEYVMYFNRDTNERSYEFYCCRYDAEGKLESSVELTELLEENGESLIQEMDLDADNRIYLYCMTGILLLDAEGTGAGYIDLGEYSQVESMGSGRDGKVYIAVYAPKDKGYVLKELDFKRKKLGSSYRNFIDIWLRGRLVMGQEKDFLGSDYYGLYEYDMRRQIKAKVLNWMDHDVNPDNIKCLYSLEDGRIAVLTYDEVKEENRSELAILSKMPVSEAPQKVEITIGSLYDDSRVRLAAVNFNKRSDKYHVSVKSYFDESDVKYSWSGDNYREVLGDAVNRLNADIVSDNCPDMLVLDGLNASRYASKGMFEDLNGWLDGSDVVRRSDYFENALECYTCGGILVAIPKSFSISTLMGRVSDLGTEPGWTLQEIIDYANAHPNAQLLANMDAASTLETLLRYTQDNFVDWRSGQCSFDSDTFVELLKFADRFSKTVDSDTSYPVRIGKGEILLNTLNLQKFEDLQMWEAMFDGPVNYIGYPNENGDSGTYLTDYTGGLAITAGSANKEGAWAFVEDFLNEYNSNYDHAFFPQISRFEAEKAEAVRIDYLYEYVYGEDGTFLLDGEGNPVCKLDEEGNPVIRRYENGTLMTRDLGGYVQIGDWVYNTHTTTEEETDRVEELVRIAKPASNYDIEILNIVNEEVSAFFNGHKSAEEVASLIQKRVQLYVDENR